MGKKAKNNNSLGRSLIKDRFGHSGRFKKGEHSLLHTADINDGYDWGRLNLQSVTEESSFQEFLSTAQLAGTEFQAEKLNIKFVDSKAAVGLMSDEEKKKIVANQEKNKHLVGIPRRPPWDETTTAEELRQREQESFLEWRRQLATLQEAEGLLLTPYEKNLEFWRQLWRVVERSDVVVQIVDARNPLLYRCADLESYVSEQGKLNLLLLNKADLLTAEQRAAWARHFRDDGVAAAFFSATRATEDLVEEDEEDTERKEEIDGEESGEEDGGEGGVSTDEEDDFATADDDSDDSWEDASDGSSEDAPPGGATSPASTVGSDNTATWEDGRLLTRSELVRLFRRVSADRPKVTPGVSTVGLVGYPNVGKSSTVNALAAAKKVSVSATPGKTKHFQTLFLSRDLMLCDCPGLVMPSFALSKAEMVCWGVLPVDQMRDHVPPVALVASLVPRHVLERTYGLLLPPPLEGEDPGRPPSARELLDAHGYCRGFMTQNGQPDNARSARYVLKDFISGRLLYCHAPPGVPQDEYHTFPALGAPRRDGTAQMDTPAARRALKPNRVTSEDIDRQFFGRSTVGVHVRGTVGVGSRLAAGSCDGRQSAAVSKPWKDHREKRNRREKTRRLYAHLDQ